MTTTDHPPEPTRDRPSSRNLRQARGGVLVLGGGFAAASVARALGRAGATVVNPTTFMLYTPILPEAASGTLEPRRAAVGIRDMCPHAELLVGRVSGIDTERRLVRVETDVGGCDVGPPLPLQDARTGGQPRPAHGIAVVFGISLSGFVGWLMARVYHLLQIPGRSLRARVASEWHSRSSFGETPPSSPRSTASRPPSSRANSMSSRNMKGTAMRATRKCGLRHQGGLTVDRRAEQDRSA